jgi:hypothetical protein
MKTYIYLFIIAIALVSCGKDPKIDWDLQKHNDMLVVNGEVTSDTINQYVRLTVSQAYYDSKEPRTVSGANVSVSDGSKIYSYTESSSLPGWYYSDVKFSGRAGNSYTLNVKLKDAINGITDYKSIEIMPKGMNVDSIKCYVYDIPEFDLGEDEDDDEEVKDTTFLAVYYFGHEPQGVMSYYMAKAYRNNLPFHETSRDYFYNETRETSDYGHSATFMKNASGDDVITFKLYTITRNYYKYLEAIRKIDETGSSMSTFGPPANALGNIPNALGYFNVSYLSTIKSIAENKRNEKK